MAKSVTLLLIGILMNCLLSLCHSHQSAPICNATPPAGKVAVDKQDELYLQFVQNLEYWESEFFLWGAFGYGLDIVAPQFVDGGPPPVGVKKANLEDPVALDIITEFGYQEVGHLRVLKTNFGSIPRPLIDLSSANFAKFMDLAFGHKLNPPFDPYRDSISFFLASYIVPYIGLTGYVGVNTLLQGYFSQRVTAGLLGVEGGQDAVIRQYLFQRANETVNPYKLTVAEFTVQISELRNKLGRCGLKDEGLVVPKELGAEGKITTNVLSANVDSISYKRTANEVLRIMYFTGDESIPGGFYPKGGNGDIAKGFLRSRS